MLFRSNDTATTEIYTGIHTLSLHDALPISVLLLRGQQTELRTFFADAAQHIAQHVPDPHVRELHGVGHFAPLLAPESIAEELISFFESVRQPA